MTAAGAGLFLVADPWRLVELMVAVVVLTAVELGALTRWPQIVRWPVAVVALDGAGLVGVLVVGGPGIAYFCCAAGAAALAGALLGLRATVVWAAHATLGFVVAARFLAETRPVPEVTVFVLAFPTAAGLAGVGVAVARTALERHIGATIQLVASAQRSTAASERARLARELHDSVAKTLRGISLAALALPSSLRRHPALAEQLAGTVSAGAEAAAREARSLVAGLRLDDPGADFADRVADICRTWSRSSGIAVRLQLRPVEPSIAVRYELTRILHEALVNVERHAHAGSVLITLAEGNGHGHVHLAVTDDGRGMPRRPPGPASGHFGLVGMAERARAVGGTLTVGPADRVGTRVVVSVPPAYDAPADVPGSRS